MSESSSGIMFSQADASVGAGQVNTPNTQDSASSGSDPLSSPQRAALIGDPVPIVFGRRVGSIGGVLISPAATEARFENNTDNDVTASYHLVISEGEIDGTQVRDVFQQSCRVGTFTQAYDRRAGNWGPGNFIVARAGYLDAVPDCPIYCGTANGSYAGMTTASFINTIPAGFTQWDRQVHAFVRGGIHVPRYIEGTEGPSSNVADLVLYLMRRSSRIPDGLIDSAAMAAAATFTSVNGLFCNIELKDPSNLAGWLSQRLPYFLLRESRSGGKKGLRPLLPTNNDGTINTGAVSWVATYDEDHIIPGSFNVSYTPRADRMPFCVQVIWRQQPEDGLGMARTADVRYSGSATDGPFEQHDLSEFATSELHAMRVGAYILSRRRHVDHTLSINLRPGVNTAAVAPGDLVRVKLRRIPSSGLNTMHDYLYEVESVAKGADGMVSLSLTHFPVDSEGRSLVALDVNEARGNGQLLPTGRAAVSCDANDPGDTSVVTDDGPWDDWVILDPDPPLYEDGADFPLEDPGDGWGPGPVEDISEGVEELEAYVIADDISTDPEGTIVGSTILDGAWRRDTSTDPDVWRFTPALGNPWRWSPGGETWSYVSAAEPAEGPPPGPPELGWSALPQDVEAGTTGTISLSTPLVVYPDVFYLAADPGFARVWVTITVDNAPQNTPLGMTLAVGDQLINATIGVGLTSTEISFLMGTGLAGLTSCVSYTLSVAAASGGAYEELTSTATAAFSICPYAGTVTLLQHLWRRVSGAWTWEGPASNDWSWNAGTQAWDWTGGGAAVGEPPSPIPTSVPTPGGGETTADYQTIVLQGQVDRMPIPNPVNDLRLDHVTCAGYIDTDAIPAVSRIFIGGWEWNPSTEWWAYIDPPTGWRWHSTDKVWQYRGSQAADWGWDTTEVRWQRLSGTVAGDGGTWTWDEPTQAWVWSGGGSPTAPAGPPSTSPPEHGAGNSTLPPNGALWVWDPGGYGWTGTDYSLSYAAPTGDWRSTGVTVHYLDS